jgi:hypothetical protein
MTLAARLNSVCDFNWLRPSVIASSSDPDADIRITLAGPAKPRGNESGFGFGDSRSVTGREGCLFEDELRSDYRVVRVVVEHCC